ncbi:MAG: HEAT repeat domain-containing protein [Planctomycetota bacterium]
MLDRSSASPLAAASAVVATLAAVLLLAPWFTAVALQEAPAGPEELAARQAADAAALESVTQITVGIRDRKPDAILKALMALEPIHLQLSEKVLKRVDKALLAIFKDFEPRESVDLPLQPPLPGDDPIVIGPDPREEVRDCYVMSIGLLYDKPGGAAILLEVLKLRHIKEWPELHARVLEGLGYRRDPVLIKELSTHLVDPSPVVASAAAMALGQFNEAPVAVRRQAVAALIAALEKADAAVVKEARRSKGDEPRPAAERVAAMAVGFSDALKMLTRQSHADTKAWKSWFTSQGAEDTW